MESTEIKKVKKGKSSLLLQASFGLGILLIIGALLWSQTISFSQRSLPHNIAGFTLTNSMTGQEAISDVSQLHGLNIKIQDAWIGHYGPKATVWVSQSPTESESKYLFNAMTDKIMKGNEFFKNPQEMMVDGQKLYSVTAQDGQKHYFYQTDTRVIWIAAPPGQEMPFLQDTLRSL